MRNSTRAPAGKHRQLDLFDGDQNDHPFTGTTFPKFGNLPNTARKGRPPHDPRGIFAFIAPSIAEFEQLTAADSMEAL